jgi:aspartate ammonia-lyase
LLSSGPSWGLGEITLPAVQAGSSMMPGKVNPVIPEVVTQVAFDVVGADLTVTMVAEAGQLQLNAFQPVAAERLMCSVTQLAAAMDALSRRCIPGITLRTDAEGDESGDTAIVTAIAPIVGYGAASQLAKDAQTTGRSVGELAVSRGLLTGDQLARARRGEPIEVAADPAIAGSGERSSRERSSIRASARSATPSASRVS